MSVSSIFIGATALKKEVKIIEGGFVKIEGEDFYRILNYDQMRPFFMTVVSDSNHWLFISSNGALTAGRRNPENALFPYYSDDKIHDSNELTGPKTIALVGKEGKTLLWEPFSDHYPGIYSIQRNMYKSIYGNKIIFEEVNLDLELRFRYGWYSSDRYGFVRKAMLENTGSSPVRLRLLDGLQNLLPYGVNKWMQSEQSTLVDAYKKNELLPDTGLGLFTLSSIPVDRAEPSEALKATTVWSVGIRPDGYLLSSLQLEDFRRGASPEGEKDIRAERGAYFIHASFAIDPGEARQWYQVAEVSQGPSAVAGIVRMLREKDHQAIQNFLEEDITRGTTQLKRIVASADGLQLTADRRITSRHFSNVMYNVMRGGVADDNYQVDKNDLQQFIRSFNSSFLKSQQSFFDQLPARIDYPELLRMARQNNDHQLIRLCQEYLPLTFSRRHGDPSRPWNRFSIELKDDEGERILYYQGNWRDIFQNWEALCLSFPAYIESMIAKFVNASTIDGYNPYRITRNGIDWEVIDPHDPWSYIGYWGDHQIIYLLKLMELSEKYHPGALQTFLSSPLFAYANVPYRIKAYPELIKDPQDTILFDEGVEKLTARRVREVGADGKLIWLEGTVHQVNLTEKLLVTLLAKLTNLVPEGGIWMNTQRPEWNDANNALVGRGLSMVTLYYMRRYLTFLAELFGSATIGRYELSEEVAAWLEGITDVLGRFQHLLQDRIADRDRRSIMDALGTVGDHYREKVYTDGFSGKKSSLDKQDLLDFLQVALAYTDHSIQANRREDTLYHSYNLLSLSPEGEAEVHHLYEMLEGQVAVLSAGCLPAGETLALLRSLRQSDLYRKDQDSYILYPDRQLPRFTQKNNIPAGAIRDSKLLQQLLADGNRQLLEQDTLGQYHFPGHFRNARDVAKALDSLSEGSYKDLVKKERQQILDLFESLFDHKSFTGRSGTFYGYEGLGCIYWHMVSKLLLAAQENCVWAHEAGAGSGIIASMIDHYYDIRAGIGFNKTPEEYGAFPMDAYSHTPGNAGAQQPGMTGQVKEDILSRFGELGVFIGEGKIRFDPFLLQASEFLKAPAEFEYMDVSGHNKRIDLREGALAFTLCQVPVIYRLSGDPGIVVTLKDGTKRELDGLQVDEINSARIFNRTGEVAKVEVHVRKARL